MTEKEISLACFAAVFADKVKVPHCWDLAAAVRFRDAIFALPEQPVPKSVSVMEIYNALLPMFDIRTTDDDACMPAYRPPAEGELGKTFVPGQTAESCIKERESRMGKIFLKKVEGYYDEDGAFTPTAFCWEDGTRYAISSVADRRLGHSPLGGIGTRYLCTICTKNLSHQRVLFHDEKSRWFIEAAK